MPQTIQFRRGTAAQWRAVNPVLAAGEPGYETDSGFEKRGDGVTTWELLPYAGGGATGTAFLTITSSGGPEAAPVAGDVITAKLVDGVVGDIQFTRGVGRDPIAGALTAGVNEATYVCVLADASALIDVKVYNPAFITGGLYAAPVADTTAPALRGISIADNERDTVAIEFWEPLVLIPPPANSAFTLTGTVAGAAKSVLSTTLSNVGGFGIAKVKYDSNFTGGDSPIISYAVPASNPLRDLANNLAVAITAQAVFNSIPVPVTLLHRYNAQPEAYTEVVPGSFKNLAMRDGGIYFQGLTLEATGSNNKAIFVDDGFIQFNCDYAGAVETAVGLGLNPDNGFRGQMPVYAMYSNGAVKLKTFGDVQEFSYAFPTVAAGNRAALFFTALDRKVALKTSVDSGVTWTQQAIASVTLDPEVDVSLLCWVHDGAASITGVGAVGAVNTF